MMYLEEVHQVEAAILRSKTAFNRPIGRANTRSACRSNRAGLGYGGAYRDRTDDPLLAKQVLSQLS